MPLPQSKVQGRAQVPSHIKYGMRSADVIGGALTAYRRDGQIEHVSSKRSQECAALALASSRCSADRLRKAGGNGSARGIARKKAKPQFRQRCRLIADRAVKTAGHDGFGKIGAGRFDDGNFNPRIRSRIRHQDRRQPATWAMMLMEFVGVGFMMTYRLRKSVMVAV
jgi:hypothetical protein